MAISASARQRVTSGLWGGRKAGSFAGREEVAPPAVAQSSPQGVRRARFLRRAPRLPWEQDDEQEASVVVAKPRRKRIALPEAKALQAVAADTPIRLVSKIQDNVIRVPNVQVPFDEDDEDELLWLI